MKKVLLSFQENTHFSSSEVTSTIGDWKLKWNIVAPLIDDKFE